MRGRVLAALAATLVLGTAVPATAAPGPPKAPEYWFDSWHIPALWDAGARGQGVTIAEIDTGVNAALPELAGRILPGTDLGVGGDGHIDREVNGFGHGTAMASIMVARPGLLNIAGIAPDAKILPIAVPLTGTTDAGAPDNLADAISYAANHGAKIINMSLGADRTARTNPVACPDDEQQAIFGALRKGTVVIASVGNNGSTGNAVEEPGVCLGVVSVGAINRDGSVASFSSRQPYLTVVAPGVNIPSLGRTQGTAYSGNGTSQATAIVSAVTALIRSKYPKLSGEQVVTRLLATLDNKRGTPSTSYGYGAVNAYRAVTASVPATARNPVYDLANPYLDRADALARPLPKPPAPAGRSAEPGSYAVGGVPHDPTEERGGIAIGAAGLLVLVAVLALGARRRHARTVAARLAAAPPAPFENRPMPGPRAPD